MVTCVALHKRGGQRTTFGFFSLSTVRSGFEFSSQGTYLINHGAGSGNLADSCSPLRADRELDEEALADPR